MSSIDASQRSAARIAGAAGLVATVTVVASNFGIFVPLIVDGDAARTASNILAHQTLFRIGVACDLVYSASLLVLVAALYVVLRPVNRTLALVAALFRLVYAGMWVLSALNMLRALRLLGDTAYLRAFETDWLQSLARLDVGANFDAYYAGLPFFALASTLCAWLWFRSRYIPRALAGFGVVASAWCVLCAFAFLVFPDFDQVVNAWAFDTPMALFEIATSVWLLFRGLPNVGIAAPAQTGARIA
jgi:hypothetical protein